MRSRPIALAVGIWLALTVSGLVVRLHEGFPLLPVVPLPVSLAPRIHVVPSSSRGYALPRGQWPAANQRLPIGHDSGYADAGTSG